MAESIDEYLCYSVENLETLTVNHLKQVLKNVSEQVTGKKASLVSRLYAYICRVNAQKQENLDINQGLTLTVDITIPEQCTFDDLIVLADEAGWTNDLRLLPNVNFHQLYQYLVERTRKYGDQIMKGTVFKKERAYSVILMTLKLLLTKT
ncbi:hypothetical protein DPMN_030763 [Dreissena polymorpha]|uniref:SAP domain-containing protein n=1 Tax=Dreissena polymorpha TaxID=45954 RepID=A0A9D4RGG8_DREPO|nr:hypothetical protein DPMN_030763 [Dreissena polymorpha]